jgi:copper ion binding protein
MRFLFALTVIILLGWHLAAAVAAETKGTFVIQGLHCPPCTSTVESALAKIKGVQSAKIDWKTKNARITFDEQVISAQQLAQTIAGTPHMMGGGLHYKGTLALQVAGLKDDAAIKTAKDTLGQVAGVSKVYVYPQQQSVLVEFAAGGKTTSQQLIEALAKAGFQASEFR